MNKQLEFLVKMRDAFLIAADATNEYIEALAPPEVKEHVVEGLFLALKFEPQQGAKLGSFEVGYQTNAENSSEKFALAYDTLKKANAEIKERYHGKNYQFSYWLFGEGKIYRQKLKKEGEQPSHST